MSLQNQPHWGDGLVFAQHLRKAVPNAVYRATPESDRVIPAQPLLYRDGFPFPAWISYMGSRGTPETHVQESLLDTAAGVQKTKRKLIVPFDKLWSCVLHSLFSSWVTFLSNSGITSKVRGIYLLLWLLATVNSIVLLPLGCLSAFLPQAQPWWVGTACTRLAHTHQGRGRGGSKKQKET